MAGEPRVTRIADLCAAIYLQHGPGEPMPDHCPTGLWEHAWFCAGVEYRLQLNCRNHENDKVPPFGHVVYGNGWPICIGDPFGGAVCLCNEDELITVLERRAKEFPDRKAVTT